MTAPDLIAKRLDEAEARPERPVYRVRPMGEVIADGKAHVAERDKEKLCGYQLKAAMLAVRKRGLSWVAIADKLTGIAAECMVRHREEQRKAREAKP